VLDTADGERVIVWHVPPRDGWPVFVYFHGNGGSLRWREERFHDLIDDGSGLVALSYRGYGGSSGRPTEKGLIEDARATYAFAVTRYFAERLVLWGESLGSALALRRQPRTRSGVSCWRLLYRRATRSVMADGNVYAPSSVIKTSGRASRDGTVTSRLTFVGRHGRRRGCEQYHHLLQAFTTACRMRPPIDPGTRLHLI
jgi:pimeloyl-ACP methyl ester carboxylesterase